MLWSSTAVWVMHNSLFLHRQHLLAQCQPDSTLTVDKENTKPSFFAGWIYVELTQSCCLGADTEGKIVANMWSSAHKAFDVTIKKIWKEAASPPKPLLSSTHITMDSCVLQNQLSDSAVFISSDSSTIQYKTKHWKISLISSKYFLWSVVPVLTDMDWLWHVNLLLSVKRLHLMSLL